MRPASIAGGVGAGVGIGGGVGAGDGPGEGDGEGEGVGGGAGGGGLGIGGSGTGPGDGPGPGTGAGPGSGGTWAITTAEPSATAKNDATRSRRRNIVRRPDAKRAPTRCEAQKDAATRATT